MEIKKFNHNNMKSYDFLLLVNLIFGGIALVLWACKIIDSQSIHIAYPLGCNLVQFFTLILLFDMINHKNNE